MCSYTCFLYSSFQNIYLYSGMGIRIFPFQIKCKLKLAFITCNLGLQEFRCFLNCQCKYLHKGKLPFWGNLLHIYSKILYLQFRLCINREGYEHHARVTTIFHIKDQINKYNGNFLQLKISIVRSTN